MSPARRISIKKLAEIGKRLEGLPNGLAAAIIGRLPWYHLFPLRDLNREFRDAFKARLDAMTGDFLRVGREVEVQRRDPTRPNKTFRILGHRMNVHGKMYVRLLENGTRQRRCKLRIYRDGTMYAIVPATGYVALGKDTH